VAFRRVVIQAYNHTCALCGVRIITPEGRTAVSAAHIVPWSISRNDDPRNGLALCGLHHWTFDQGVVGVTEDYRITVSPVVLEEESVRSLLSLAGLRLRLPGSNHLRPAPRAIQWHWENVYISENPMRLL
jgi:putative restriction endonuclease